MMAHCKLSAIKGIRAHEWAVRFLFGGAVCVLAGLISNKFGAAVGGLFLAFPAIFPAGASLIEAHEKKHKARVGLDGTLRGRTIAGIDAAGAAIGCLGLAGFAVLCWRCLPRLSPGTVFALATVVWFLLSILFWWLRKRRPFGPHRRRHTEHAFRAS
jgi:hypothetical protein